MNELKLFMILLGSTPPGRLVEQHDFFFGIASSLKDLVPDIKRFWPEPDKIHIDAWREVKMVEGFQVRVCRRTEDRNTSAVQNQKLFFINLGGYQENVFAEQHYTLLTVKPDQASALKEAKSTLFFQQNKFGKAVSHIDDKYGIDVDDIYQIEDILSDSQKELYRLELISSSSSADDELHLGYLKLSLLK